MRKLVFLVLLAAATTLLAQDKKETVTAAPDFLDQKLWSELGKPTEGPRGFSLYSRNVQPKSDSVFQLWVKILPANATVFNRRYSLPRDTSFVIQYATVDCNHRSVMFERTSAYDGANRFVDARGSDLVKNENRAKVRSGSVGETVFLYLCEKLQ